MTETKHEEVDIVAVLRLIALALDQVTRTKGVFVLYCLHSNTNVVIASNYEIRPTHRSSLTICRHIVLARSNM